MMIGDAHQCVNFSSITSVISPLDFIRGGN